MPYIDIAARHRVGPGGKRSDFHNWPRCLHYMGGAETALERSVVFYADRLARTERFRAGGVTDVIQAIREKGASSLFPVFSGLKGRLFWDKFCDEIEERAAEEVRLLREYGVSAEPSFSVLIQERHGGWEAADPGFRLERNRSALSCWAFEVTAEELFETVFLEMNPGGYDHERRPLPKAELMALELIAEATTKTKWKLSKAAKAVQAVQLRLEGCSFLEIAKELGISGGEAHRLVTALMPKEKSHAFSAAAAAD